MPYCCVASHAGCTRLLICPGCLPQQCIKAVAFASLLQRNRYCSGVQSCCVASHAGCTRLLMFPGCQPAVLGTPCLCQPPATRQVLFRNAVLLCCAHSCSMYPLADQEGSWHTPAAASKRVPHVDVNISTPTHLRCRLHQLHQLRLSDLQTPASLACNDCNTQ